MRPLHSVSALLASLTLCTLPLSARTIYVSPDGSGNGSSADSPLPDIYAAFVVAQGGDVIELAAGEYDTQRKLMEHPQAQEWTENVVVRPAAGAKAVLGGQQWFILSPRVTLIGLHLKIRVAARRGSDHFRMENCVSELEPGQVASVTVSGNHSQIINNLFDGSAGDSDAIVVTSGHGESRATDILIEGNTIRNYVYQAGGVHEDGIQLYDCENVTIRRNRIINVGNSCIILSGGRANQPMPNIRIENNFISRGENKTKSLALDLRYKHATGVVLVNNTILGSVSVAPNDESYVRNNIISWLSNKDCPEDHNYIVAWNEGIGVQISSESRAGELPAFVNAEAGDLHISAENTVVLDFGTAQVAPDKDIDGQARGTSIWVGADDPSNTSAPDPFGQ